MRFRPSKFIVDSRSANANLNHQQPQNEQIDLIPRCCVRPLTRGRSSNTTTAKTSSSWFRPLPQFQTDNNKNDSSLFRDSRFNTNIIERRKRNRTPTNHGKGKGIYIRQHCTGHRNGIMGPRQQQQVECAVHTCRCAGQRLETPVSNGGSRLRRVPITNHFWLSSRSETHGRSFFPIRPTIGGSPWIVGMQGKTALSGPNDGIRVVEPLYTSSKIFTKCYTQ